jgi:hypothetical protein
MKKLVVFILLTALGESVYAQNCTQPLPNQQFQQKYNQIKNRPTENTKLTTAKQIATNYCFSSAQVKELAALFENDYDRYEFAKVVYPNTTDKENFYDVYDAFLYYSVVFRLHDFIRGLNQENTGTNQETTNEIQFPDYKYPSYRLYSGNKNCHDLIPEHRFDLAVKKIFEIKNDEARYNNAIDYVRNNCLATAHLMKIASLLDKEYFRLNFAKEAFNSVYDLDNYIEMKQVFNTPKVRSEFMNFLSSQGSTTDNSCKVTESEYNQIISTIRNEKFNSTKLNSAKHLIQTKKCFTSEQIKGIIDLFDYENSRLDIAFYAYDFVIDPTDYYTTVSQAIGFESNKKRLLDYINNKK